MRHIVILPMGRAFLTTVRQPHYFAVFFAVFLLISLHIFPNFSLMISRIKFQGF